MVEQFYTKVSPTPTEPGSQSLIFEAWRDITTRMVVPSHRGDGPSPKGFAKKLSRRNHACARGPSGQGAIRDQSALGIKGKHAEAFFCIANDLGAEVFGRSSRTDNVDPLWLLRISSKDLGKRSNPRSF